MNCAWWKIQITCSKCKNSVELQEVHHSADGELLFVCACHVCKAQVNWQVYASKLSYLAMINDFQKTQKKKPQKLLPPIDEAKADKEFLHGLNILDDDEAA